MNGYDLTRRWFNFKFDDPQKVRSGHTELFFYILDLWNRLGQKEVFGLPTSVTMETLGIGSYNTYKKLLNDLVDFGFILIISKSTNQYQSKRIAISKFDKALDEPLDKAHVKALDEPLDKALDTIDKQLTTNNETTEQLNNILLKKESKKAGIVNDKKIDFEKIKILYNEILPMIPKVEKLNKQRMSLIKARIKEYEPEDPEELFSTAFKKVSQSDFLTGKAETVFHASFDWILKPSNFLKIREGNYENKKNTTKAFSHNRPDNLPIRRNI